MRAKWRRPEVLLLSMAAAVPLSFSTWMALLDNFAIHRAAFTGREIGILQSLREIPGFLAFAVIFLLLIIREQRLAYLALALLGLGTALTGLFPTAIGLYLTTVAMSLGYHYYETLQSSLALHMDRQGPRTRNIGPHHRGRVFCVRPRLRCGVARGGSSHIGLLVDLCRRGQRHRHHHTGRLARLSPLS